MDVVTDNRRWIGPSSKHLEGPPQRRLGCAPAYSCLSGSWRLSPGAVPAQRRAAMRPGKAGHGRRTHFRRIGGFCLRVDGEDQILLLPKKVPVKVQQILSSPANLRLRARPTEPGRRALPILVCPVHDATVRYREVGPGCGDLARSSTGPLTHRDLFRGQGRFPAQRFRPSRGQFLRPCPDRGVA